MKPTITLAFTDIVNSTELSKNHSAIYEEAWTQHNHIVRQALQKWNGQEIKTMGDSFFVSFAAPADAVQWAHEAQRELTRFAWPPEVPLHVRIGMHTGQAVPYSHPNGLLDYRGGPVNLAARVSAMSQGGQILVSQDTRDHVLPHLPPAFDWHDWGLCELKGIGRERLWQVCHPDLAAPHTFARPAGFHLPAAVPAINNLPYAHNPHFVGRDALLPELHRHLQRSAPQPVALVGMSGMGKTQLASEYAHASLSDYPEGVFWLNARDEQRLWEDFSAIGRRFFDLTEAASLRQSAEQWYDVLRRTPHPALLIFDNVTEDFDFALLPSTGTMRVLLTTQRKPLPENIQVMELRPLDLPDALTLLQTSRRAVRREEQKAARTIAETVGCLPLGLSLCAQHIRALGYHFTAYCDRITQDPHKTLQIAAQRFRAATGHDGNLYYTIHSMSKELDRNALRIMKAAICFAPRGISTPLLFAASGLTSQEKFDDALATPWSQCFVVYETANEDALTPRLSVHELVQAYFRERVPGAQRRTLLTRAVQVLTQHLQGLNERLDVSAARREIEHCHHAARLCREIKDIPGQADLLYEIGRYLFEQRDLQGALGCFGEGLALAEAQEPDSLLCARFLRESGVAWQDANEPVTALRQTRRALCLAGKRLAPDDPRLAEYYNSLGYVLKKQNCLSRALPFYRRALFINETAHGQQHEETAICLNNIGALLEARGDYDAALISLHRALAIGEAVSGPHHSTAAVRCNNIGRIYGKQENWQSALNYHQRAYTIYEAAYDAQHPNLGATCYYLAEARRGLGQRDGVEGLYERALSIYLKACGPDDAMYRMMKDRYDSFRGDV